MKKIDNNILCWCENPEQEAINQAINISKHPCLVGNVCLMPDTHSGYGMPIGGVVALKDAVSPNMVGVDIGCGMFAQKTGLTGITQVDLERLVKKIRAKVPTGFNKHKEPAYGAFFGDKRWNELPICSREQDNARHSMGTLGGGNHFIEIQKGEDGHIWFMIHTGSRNLGKRVADHYNKEAENLCTMFKQDDVVKNELAFLPRGHELFDMYMAEMGLCLEFAQHNRAAIAREIINSFKELGLDEHLLFNDTVSTIHNYADAVEYFTRTDLIIHRKGAVQASKGKPLIIPGSQGTSSYICHGLGSAVSFYSCSHGAGRTMSRKKAKENLDLAAVQEKMNAKGIIHNIRTEDDLDEAPDAYKDIDVVMEEQKDLVEISVKLNPIAVIKG